MERLRAWPWPDDIRELEHAVERAVVLGRRTTIEVERMPIEETLKTTGGNKQRAADQPGITARTIYCKRDQ